MANHPILKCSVCEKNDSACVCCVPGVPVSMSYCRECLTANAHPWSILVANTAVMGGLHVAAGWWKDMVDATCKHLGKTLEQFNSDVRAALEGV